MLRIHDDTEHCVICHADKTMIVTARVVEKLHAGVPDVLRWGVCDGKSCRRQLCELILAGPPEPYEEAEA